MGNCKSAASAAPVTNTSNHTAATRGGDEEDVDIPSSLVCVVCYSLLATSTSFSCGHTLCWSCAEKWLGEDLDEGDCKGCPECRQPVGELRRCIALDHLAAEVAARWPAGSSRLEQWEQARDAGLALASCYAERHPAKRADAQQSEALPRLGMRRGWRGEPDNWLTPYGLAFNEPYENDDTFFATAPFAPFLMPRQGTSVPFGTSSSEASSSDDEEEEYHDDALELQEDTDAVLPQASRWMNDNISGSPMNDDDAEDGNSFNSSSEDEAASPDRRNPNGNRLAIATSLRRLDPNIRSSNGEINVHMYNSRNNIVGGPYNDRQESERNDSVQNSRTTAAATAADRGPEGLRGFLGLFVQQNGSSDSAMHVTAEGNSSSPVEATLELLFDVMEAEGLDSSVDNVTSASANMPEASSTGSLPPEYTDIDASILESPSMAESAAASAAAAAASVAAVVKLSWDSAGTIVNANTPPAPDISVANRDSLEGRDTTQQNVPTTSSQPPLPPTLVETTLQEHFDSRTSPQMAADVTRKGCYLCSVAFKAGVVRVRKAGPLSLWAHWRCFAESSLVQVCHACALDAAHGSRRSDNRRPEPSLNPAPTDANAGASPVAAPEHSAASTPRVRLHLRCDFLDASQATMNEAVDAGVCGPLERTRQRQRAVVASSLGAALTASVACSWLEIVRSGSLWSRNRPVGSSDEVIEAANRLYTGEGEVDLLAAVPAERRRGRGNRHHSNTVHVSISQQIAPLGNVEGAESASSDGDDESRHEPTSATASEEEDDIGLRGDGAQPIA